MGLYGCQDRPSHDVPHNVGKALAAFCESLPICPSAHFCPIRLVIRRVPRSRCLGLNPSGSVVCHDASSVRRYPASARAVRSRCASVTGPSTARSARWVAPSPLLSLPAAAKPTPDDPEDPTDERYAAARSGYALAPLKARSIQPARTLRGAAPAAAALAPGSCRSVGSSRRRRRRRCRCPSAMALTMAYAELGLCVGRTQRGEGGGDGDRHRPRRWRGSARQRIKLRRGHRTEPASLAHRLGRAAVRALRRGAAAIRKLFRQQRPEVDVERRQLEAERRQTRSRPRRRTAAPGPPDPRPPQRGGDPDRDRARTRERRPARPPTPTPRITRRAHTTARRRRA